MIFGILNFLISYLINIIYISTKSKYSNKPSWLPLRLFFLPLRPKIVFANRASWIFFQPSTHTLRMKLMCAWQFHTIFSFLEITIAYDAFIWLLVLFFIFSGILIDWKLPYLLLRQSLLLLMHSITCQKMYQSS